MTADAASGAAISGAGVGLQVFSGSSCSGTVAASGTGTTNSNGQVNFTFTTKNQGTYCALATVSASDYENGTGETSFTT